MKQYAVSMCAHKLSAKLYMLTKQTIHHSVTTLYANNKDEAVGKGFKMLYELCPREDDWQGYDVDVIEVLEEK